MRKFIIAAMAASLVFLTMLSPAAASFQNNAVFTVGQSTYVVNGQAKQMDAAAFLQQPQDRVFVPVRYLAYSLGLTDSGITWDQTSQMVILTLGNTTVVLSPKEKTYYVNGQAKQMDTLPLIKNGRVYLPTRYVAQAFGYGVSWDQSTDSVVIGAAQSNSSAGTQSTAEYNVQIVPFPSSAQTGQSVQLAISVTNTNNQVASGVTLVLTSNSPTTTLNPAEVTTNSSGQGIVTATDSAAETVTLTATILNSYTTATASVQWTGSSTQTGNYTVHLSGSSTSATGGQPVVFTATVDNNSGSPVSGTGVTIASSSANAVPSATSLVTNAEGQAFFTATDNSAESVTFTATPTGGGSAQTASVTWSAPPSAPSYTSYATTPSLQISSTATTAAAGEPVEYTVSATGNYGVAADTTLDVISSSANAPPSSSVLTTNNAGQAFFTATDSVAESATFTVRMSSNTAVMNNSTTQWLSSYTQTTQSSTSSLSIGFVVVSDSANSVTVGQPVAFTVTAGDNLGTPVSGASIIITDNSTQVNLSSANLLTNAQGQAFFTATDKAVETVTFTISPTNGGPSKTIDILWGTGSPITTTSGQTTPSLQIASTVATASLGQPVVYTVTATGTNGLAAGTSVLVTSNSTNVQMGNTILTTNSHGQAFFTASDSVGEYVVFTARMANIPTVEATNATQWVLQQANLSQYTPVYSLGITPSASTATLGQPVILTMRVVDVNNQPASSIGISLISNSGSAQLSSTYVTSNSQGLAYVTVTDNANETVNFTANLANVTARRPYFNASIQWVPQGSTSSAGYSNSQVSVSGYNVVMSEASQLLQAGQPDVLTFTVTNSSGQAVSGLPVEVSASSGNVGLSQANLVTNSYGQAFCTATDNTGESVTFSVEITNASSLITPVAAGTVRWY